jgi:hypothetical protein
MSIESIEDLTDSDPTERLRRCYGRGMEDLVERLRFDPTEGVVIRSPSGTGYGHWVGGHKVSFDPVSGLFVLFARTRTPLEQGRGGACEVAISEDGIDFDTVWTASKDEFAASSIEVGHVVPDGAGGWRLYVSYERPAQRDWRIDVLEAPDPSAFVAQHRRTVLQPQEFGLSFIKDPWIVARDDGGVDLFAAVPARRGPTVEGDRITIGTDDATVVTTSADGLIFRELTYVLEATGEDTWDGHRGRLDSLFPAAGRWVGFYSGGRTMYDNYEEPAGVVVSDDARNFTRITTDGPMVTSPYGCVRYLWGSPVGDRLHIYYEYTRRDGSHDLRVSTVPLP